MSEAKGQSFVEKLDKESLAYFSEVGKKSFSDQAIFVLNAFFDEIGDQAEYIYQVAWEIMKQADMRAKGTKYLHLYDEGCDLDFDLSLHFFELLCKFHDDTKNAKWNGAEFAKSKPKEMTAIVRKKEIRDTVDVNFDGRMSFLEYLLYQYQISPKDFITRSVVKDAPVNEALIKARAALDEVNKRIRAYEAEKTRLEELAASGTGVKALGAKNQLAQLHASPLADDLRKALITAEAAVRIATKQGGSVTSSSGAVTAVRTAGEVWWLNREIKTKKEKYGAPAAK